MPSPFQQTLLARAYHYVHPKTGRPIRQFRRYGDPRYINNEAALIRGQWGLITADFGMVTQSQMENARLAILRRLPRGSFTLTMHTDYEEFPVVKKSPESRMGAGKANIHHFAFKFTTGVPLFEIMPISARRLNQAEAEGIFLAGRPFIPLQTVVVPQGRVDEYHVFK
ncbi:50S ribosomal protein L16, putative [Trypanosoma equiperdum]|uniref:50S ribosomal protein L16, putative n=4 Tax=Trypanozoon TaxID=39700 RepID=Q57UM6_TRYB2|nr:50S ribosomal protein L16, putative [Trypanosoma brucei gambiense DAL972]XP_846019.1 50S ribosomal protein L16, putative [Trypanosoma brucei brucei TREU927]6HIV_AQ Chain AQ, 50S ribosomal protein L16, putative [Trypanosoma brucei brucei]6HIX_AQ Chain AQ, 50S ribosomal protein L16, putative [Trypanosoma brucei brucei]AAX70693.1 50S ribosomal protein L16, putative [Trypanosoma brucei]RHW71483.1 50S ribosomal protein L16 [Trypanosoma brucei equiperdum]SCU69889.1 50S ribosomal protein L16, put|eukprot:XP_011774798.1 50S ribosomal protein L16, putative [Trypanosoma brucei gambiense DAL972]